MKPRVALIGLGKFGETHLRVLRTLHQEGRLDLAAVADIDRKLVDGVMGSVRASTDYATLLNNEIDAVDIVTPASTHYQVAKQCLEAGKHVLVEKPMALRHSEAQSLVKEARSRGLTLMVGHIFRYDLTLARVKSLIAEGKIGALNLVKCNFEGAAEHRADVGALLNYIHAVDILDYLIEKTPLEISCRAGYFRGGEFEDYALLTMSYPSGILGVAEMGWTLPPKSRNIVVVGSEACLRATLRSYPEPGHIAIHYFSPSKTEEVKVGSNGEEPLKAEISNFVDSIGGVNEPLASGEVGERSIMIGEKALEAAKLGKSVSLQLRGSL